MDTVCQTLIKSSFFFISLCCYAQAPVWVFTPVSPTKLTVTNNSIATVIYNITNQSRKKHTLALKPAVGIHQITTPNNCASPFTLNYQESCLLELQITGSALQQDILDGPVVCEHGNPLQCYQPGPRDTLNVTRSEGNFLVVSDIHLNQDAVNITYGEDTGTILFASTLSEITNVINKQNPPFMIYLGDSPAHTQLQRASNIQLVLEALSGEVKRVPLFYVYANNDSYSLSTNPTANYGPFSQNGVNLFSLDPAAPWPALNVTTCPASTACTYPDTHLDMMYAQKYGFYSAYPLGSDIPLRFIAINSVIFSYQYTEPLTIQQAEAQLELDWLASQLQDAKIKNEQVYMAMHIPAGDGAFNSGHPDFWNTSIVLNGMVTPSLQGLTLRNAFLSLISEYKQTIGTLITGHTHMEEYRILYWGTPYQPTLLNVGVPGITPLHDNNPGMQVYYHDKAFHLIDALTYYTTPDAAAWLTFGFKNDYSCSPRSTMFGCLLSQLIPYLTRGSESVARYETNYSVRSPAFTPEPDTTWANILKTIQVYPIG